MNTAHFQQKFILADIKTIARKAFCKIFLHIFDSCAVCRIIFANRICVIFINFRRNFQCIGNFFVFRVIFGSKQDKFIDFFRFGDSDKLIFSAFLHHNNSVFLKKFSKNSKGRFFSSRITCIRGFQKIALFLVNRVNQ